MVSKRTSKIMIGFIVFLFVLVIGFLIFIQVVSGMSPVMMSLLGVGILSSIVLVGSFCVWVYQDSKKRGDNGVLWVFVVLMTSPIVGLIIYLICRKEDKVLCRNCQALINHSSNYCEQCGSINEKMEGKIMKSTKRNIGYIVTGVISSLVMIGCFITFIVFAVTSDEFSEQIDWNPGFTMLSYESQMGNKWVVKFKYASDGYTKKDTLTIDDSTQMLVADITSSQGEVLLHLIQGDQEEILDVSNLDETLEYPLTAFESGKIKLVLEMNGARDFSSTITIK